MNASSPIVAALEQLQLERTNLAARLEKVDALIASMRDVFHLPARANGTRRAVAASPPTNGRGLVSADAIRAALKDGPLKPGELAEQLGIPRARLRYTLKQLEADGTVVSTGVTSGRRVALPGRPAKEAP